MDRSAQITMIHRAVEDFTPVPEGLERDPNYPIWEEWSKQGGINGDKQNVAGAKPIREFETIGSVNPEVAKRLYTVMYNPARIADIPATTDDDIFRRVFRDATTIEQSKDLFGVDTEGNLTDKGRENFSAALVDAVGRSIYSPTSASEKQEVLNALNYLETGKKMNLTILGDNVEAKYNWAMQVLHRAKEREGSFETGIMSDEVYNLYRSFAAYERGETTAISGAGVGLSTQLMQAAADLWYGKDHIGLTESATDAVVLDGQEGQMFMPLTRHATEWRAEKFAFGAGGSVMTRENTGIPGLSYNDYTEWDKADASTEKEHYISPLANKEEHYTYWTRKTADGDTVYMANVGYGPDGQIKRLIFSDKQLGLIRATERYNRLIKSDTRYLEYLTQRAVGSLSSDGRAWLERNHGENNPYGLLDRDSDGTYVTQASNLVSKEEARKFNALPKQDKDTLFYIMQLHKPMVQTDSFWKTVGYGLTQDLDGITSGFVRGGNRLWNFVTFQNADEDLADQATIDTMNAVGSVEVKTHYTNTFLVSGSTLSTASFFLFGGTNAGRTALTKWGLRRGLPLKVAKVSAAVAAELPNMAFQTLVGTQHRQADYFVQYRDNPEALRNGLALARTLNILASLAEAGSEYLPISYAKGKMGSGFGAVTDAIKAGERGKAVLASLGAVTVDTPLVAFNEMFQESVQGAGVAMLDNLFGQMVDHWNEYEELDFGPAVWHALHGGIDWDSVIAAGGASIPDSAIAAMGLVGITQGVRAVRTPLDVRAEVNRVVLTRQVREERDALSDLLASKREANGIHLPQWEDAVRNQTERLTQLREEQAKAAGRELTDEDRLNIRNEARQMIALNQMEQLYNQWAGETDKVKQKKILQDLGFSEAEVTRFENLFEDLFHDRQGAYNPFNTDVTASGIGRMLNAAGVTGVAVTDVADVGEEGASGVDIDWGNGRKTRVVMTPRMVDDKNALADGVFLHRTDGKQIDATNAITDLIRVATSTNTGSTKLIGHELAHNLLSIAREADALSKEQWDAITKAYTGKDGKFDEERLADDFGAYLEEALFLNQKKYKSPRAPKSAGDRVNQALHALGVFFGSIARVVLRRKNAQAARESLNVGGVLDAFLRDGERIRDASAARADAAWDSTHTQTVVDEDGTEVAYHERGGRRSAELDSVPTHDGIGEDVLDTLDVMLRTEGDTTIYTREYGDVLLAFGRFRNQVPGLKGNGFLHVLEERTSKDGLSTPEAVEVFLKAVEAAVRGKENKALRSSNRHAIELNGYRAIVADNGDFREFITGYKIFTDEEKKKRSGVETDAIRRSEDYNPAFYDRLRQEGAERLKERIAQLLAGRQVPKSVEELEQELEDLDIAHYRLLNARKKAEENGASQEELDALQKDIDDNRAKYKQVAKAKKKLNQQRAKVRKLYGDPNEERRDHIKVWSGAPQEFAVPSLAFVGTGTGGNNEGRGVYSSGVRGVDHVYEYNPETDDFERKWHEAEGASGPRFTETPLGQELVAKAFDAIVGVDADLLLRPWHYGEKREPGKGLVTAGLGRDVDMEDPKGLAAEVSARIARFGTREGDPTLREIRARCGSKERFYEVMGSVFEAAIGLKMGVQDVITQREFSAMEKRMPLYAWVIRHNAQARATALGRKAYIMGRRFAERLHREALEAARAEARAKVREANAKARASEGKARNAERREETERHRRMRAEFSAAEADFIARWKLEEERAISRMRIDTIREAMKASAVEARVREARKRAVERERGVSFMYLKGTLGVDIRAELRALAGADNDPAAVAAELLRKIELGFDKWVREQRPELIENSGSYWQLLNEQGEKAYRETMGNVLKAVARELSYGKLRESILNAVDLFAHSRHETVHDSVEGKLARVIAVLRIAQNADVVALTKRRIKSALAEANKRLSSEASSARTRYMTSMRRLCKELLATFEDAVDAQGTDKAAEKRRKKLTELKHALEDELEKIDDGKPIEDLVKDETLTERQHKDAVKLMFLERFGDLSYDLDPEKIWAKAAEAEGFVRDALFEHVIAWEAKKQAAAEMSAKLMDALPQARGWVKRGSVLFGALIPSWFDRMKWPLMGRGGSQETRARQGRAARAVIDDFERRFAQAALSESRLNRMDGDEINRMAAKAYGLSGRTDAETCRMGHKKWMDLIGDREARWSNELSLDGMPLSRANLIYIYASLRQEDVHDKMAHNYNAFAEVDEEGKVTKAGVDVYLERVKAELTGEDLVLADLAVKFFAMKRVPLSEISSRLFGLPVYSPVADYVPLSVQLEDGPVRAQAPRMFVLFPNFLKNRVWHSRKLDETKTIYNVLQERSLQQNRWMAYAELYQLSQMVFNNPDVAAQYKKALGATAMKGLQKQYNEIFAGLEQSSSTGVKWLRSMAAVNGLGFNAKSAIRQWEGVAAWAVDMGIRDTAGALKDALACLVTEEGRKQWAEAFRSDIIRTRMETGTALEQRQIISLLHELMAASQKRTKTAVNIVSTLQKFSNASFVFLKYSDAIVCAMGIVGLRPRLENKWIGLGYSREDARRLANQDLDVMVQRLQQSGRPEYLSSIQRGGVAGAALTMFTGPAAMSAGIYTKAFRDLWVAVREGDAPLRREALSRLGGVMVRNMLYGFLMWITGGLFVPNDMDEEDEETYRLAMTAFSMVFGGFGGLFLFGALANTSQEMLSEWMASGEPPDRFFQRMKDDLLRMPVVDMSVGYLRGVWKHSVEFADSDKSVSETVRFALEMPPLSLTQFGPQTENLLEAVGVQEDSEERADRLAKEKAKRTRERKKQKKAKEEKDARGN